MILDATFTLPDPVVVAASATPLAGLATRARWAPGSPPGVWPARALPVAFRLGAVPTGPGWPSRADVAAELDVALRTWSLPACSGFRARFAGDATGSAWTGFDDDVATIVLHGDVWPAELEREAVAQTVVRLDVSGAVRDADVHLNGVAYRFSLDGAPGTVDLRSVLVHELGHALGLGHARDPRATMAPNGSGQRWRSLEADDLDGVCALYPGTGDGGCDARACPPSHVCVARACQRRGARGDVCAPCDPAASVPSCEAAGDGARCVDPALLSGGGAPAGSVCGRACANDADCGAGFTCRKTTAAGDLQCVAGDGCVSAASPCATDADCAGASCRAGACVGPTRAAPDTTGSDAGTAPADARDVRGSGAGCAASPRSTRAALPLVGLVALLLLARTRARGR